MADTGNGASLTLSADTNSYSVVSISPGGLSIEALDISTLGSTSQMEYIPGDLADTPELTAELLFEKDTGLPTVGSTHTVTITFPLSATTNTNATPATLAGKGFVTAIEYPELVNNQVMRSNITIKFDGGGGDTTTNDYTVTYTPEDLDPS